MFSSGGYFRGLTCPFFASGLCERPYCHFRHIRTEEERNTTKCGATSTETAPESPWQNPTGTTVQDGRSQKVKINKYTGKPEPVSGPEEYSVSHCNNAKEDLHRGGNVNKYTGEPVNQNALEEYQIEGSGYGSNKGRPSKSGPAYVPEEYQVPGPGYRELRGKTGSFPQEKYEIEGSGYSAKDRANVEEYSVEGSGYGKYMDKNKSINEAEEYSIEGSGYGEYKRKHQQNRKRPGSLRDKPNGELRNSLGGSWPEYNPTPINKLENTQNGDSNSKYTCGSMDHESEHEYDPQKNFSTGLGLNIHKPGPAKRTYSYDPTKPNFGCLTKKPRMLKEGSSDLPKFSDSDEDDGEMGKFSEEEEEEIKEEAVETEEEEEEEEDRPAMITDVKVFESLLMDSDELKEDKERMCAKNAEESLGTVSADNALETGSEKKEEDASDDTKKNPGTEETKLDGSHSRERSIFKALARLSNTMSKMKKNDLLRKDSDLNSPTFSSSLKKDSAKTGKVGESSKQSVKSSKGDSSSKSKHSRDHQSSSSCSSRKEKSKEKSSSDKSSSSKEKSSSSRHKSSKEKSSKDSSSSKHKSSSSSSKHKSSRSSHSSSSRHKSSESSSSHKENHRSDRKSSSEKKGSSERRSHSGESRHKKTSSSKHSTHEGKSASSEKEKDKSTDKGRRDSSDSQKGRRSSVDKQKIVNLNVNLFGEDSDVDMEVEEVGIMSDFSDDSDIVGDGDLTAEDPYEECLKIFKENATKLSKSVKQPFTKKFEKKEEDVAPILGKKRTAHKSDVEVKRKIPEKPLSKLSPAQVMHNRFLAMQKAALDAEKKSKEEKPITPSASTSSEEPPGKKRKAHSAFAAACGTRVVDGKTVVATASKTAKRKAHMPNVSNLKRPTIPSEFGSKVPTNVRQRYLNSIIDECLKICKTEEGAFKRGQEEEAAVYSRSNSKTVYLNVAINTIKRLRNEASENLPSPAKTAGAMKMSHEAVLGGKNAVKNSYTLNRSGGSKRDIVENFKGAEFYKRLERYILTEEQLKENGFPRPDPDDSSKVKIYTESQAQHNSLKLKLHEKICVRCGRRFMVFPNGTYANKEECTHHWGKAWKKKIAGFIDTRYTCCQGDLGSKGCQIAQYHVHETNKWENLTGFMKTLPCSPSLDGDYGVYAMDCEMVYTQGGVELARVTVTDQDNASVYETLVRPDRKVIDYNTRFSGITEEDMKDVTTTLRDVQAVLLSLFTDKTILIGHSLESDLCAVKLIHNTVVDTSVVFPHRLGPPYKRALKTLMAEYLKKIIQDDVEGHDSREDATACMDLMHWRVKEDARKEIRHQ